MSSLYELFDSLIWVLFCCQVRLLLFNCPIELFYYQACYLLYQFADFVVIKFVTLCIDKLTSLYFGWLNFHRAKPCQICDNIQGIFRCDFLDLLGQLDLGQVKQGVRVRQIDILRNRCLFSQFSDLVSKLGLSSNREQSKLLCINLG